MPSTLPSQESSNGGARIVVLLAVLFVLAWMSLARAWEHGPSAYLRHLRHEHRITIPAKAVMERLPVWHRDAA